MFSFFQMLQRFLCDLRMMVGVMMVDGHPNLNGLLPYFPEWMLQVVCSCVSESANGDMTSGGGV